ncbi:hypothetical protein ACVRW4_04290 [Streptococcus phocae subsp. phocae]|uniref:Uncharacterized protein n=1 Tax=Streptococcus phocae TaxID=119224 RepID=A0A0P6S3H9_9STRE|nr:hypothetical protein [Streptococcus phocae]KPJ21930.1 hypothetical protein AKK44_07135 [Streptococcus phocae]
MKNIFKKSMPLLAALAVTTTALPLSLAATTTVSAEAYTFPFQDTYYVEHWFEIKDSNELNKLRKKEVTIREHNNRYFVLGDLDIKKGKIGDSTKEQPKRELSNGEKVDFTEYVGREVHDLESIGASEFKTEVYIYYYLK